MDEGEARREQQSGHERESRISFGQILRSVEPPPPVPGKYTLEPPDTVPVADELSSGRRSPADRPSERERFLKGSAIAFAVGLGALLALVPARSVDPAPPGVFSEGDLSAEVMPVGMAVPQAPQRAATPSRRQSEMDRVLRTEAPDPVPHVIRLAPIQIVSALPSRQEPVSSPSPARRAMAARTATPPAPAPEPEPQLAAGKTGEAPSSPSPSSPRAELPATLNAQPERAEVAAAMRNVRGEVRRCAPDRRGAIVPVRVTFAASGRVTTAIVSGDLAGTPEGSCIALAVRDARVPTFAADTFVVSYPFTL